jgi:tetratricopeptide (TPR) repeat protein
MGRRTALLVGTYDYSDTSLQRLAAPGQDVESLAKVLVDPEIAGFDVITLINEPHHVVAAAIGNFYDGLRREDLALLYVTGHGLKDAHGRLYFAMTNTSPTGLWFTAIGADQINDAMNNCSSRQKVLILDCCYGGAFPGGWSAKGAPDVDALERFHGRGRVVLTASGAAEYSFERENLSGTGPSSLFTHYLVEGIRTGKADLDMDGDISLDELYSYVHDRVIEALPRQRPKKQDDVEGRIVIAQNVGWTLPTYVENAIESPIALARQSAIQSLAELYRIGNKAVRRQVYEQLEKLADDDSRMVSADASELIERITLDSNLQHPGHQLTQRSGEQQHVVNMVHANQPAHVAVAKTSYPQAITVRHPDHDAIGPAEGDRAAVRPDQTPKSTYELALVLEGRGDRVGAIAAYQQAVETGHQEWAPKAMINLGNLLKKRGDTVGAKAAYQQAIHSGHREWAPAAMINLGNLLKERSDAAGAKAAYQQAIRSGHPDEAPKATYNLGNLLKEQGDTVGAKAAYQQAIDSDHPMWAPAAQKALKTVKTRWA